MNLTPQDLSLICAAFIACLSLGSLHLRLYIWLFACEVALLSVSTVLTAWQTGDQGLYLIAAMIFLVKALIVPTFFGWIVEKLRTQREFKSLIPAPLSMHLCLLLFAVSFVLAKSIPPSHFSENSWLGAAAGISQLFSGLLLMLTRSLAISQVLGFLVIENGIYTFALTQTRGMPMMVEMGVLLDVMVAIMISGLLIFKIQKSFEHIDIAQLKDLRD